MRKFCNIASEAVVLNISLLQFERFRTVYGNTLGCKVSVISVLTKNITPDTVASTEISNSGTDARRITTRKKYYL
jgi:hypothetical protein